MPRRWMNRRNPSDLTKRRLRKLRQAAEALYEDDWEWFEGGRCADVSVALAMGAERAGWKNVRVISGTAQSRVGRPKVFHAWLDVGGERFDPTWEVLFGKQGRNYQGKQDDYYCFGVDPEDLEWRVDEVVMDILEE